MNLTITPQLGFDAMLEEAGEQNRRREFDRETAHLPSTMEEGVKYFRELLRDHDAAMMRADEARVFALREQADLLALKLNNGKPGILGGDDAPGCVLTRLTKTPLGQTPLWGQEGEYRIEVAGARIRVEQDGIFGVCGSTFYWPGFSAHVIDTHEPFISETGFRSFLGIHGEWVSTRNLTPPEFAKFVIERFVSEELRGKLVLVDRSFLHEDAS